MDKRKILIVDDDEAVLDFLQAKLGARYDIVSTNSPENVLQLAREHRPALILCDVDMPELDGGDISSALFADQELRRAAGVVPPAPGPPPAPHARARAAGRGTR